MIDLTPFCASVFMKRPEIEKPFILNNRLYATDGRVIIRLNMPTANAPQAQSCIPASIVCEIDKMPWDRRAENPQPIPPFKYEISNCEDCGGSGKVFLCPNCNGDGYVDAEDAHHLRYHVECGKCGGQGVVPGPDIRKEVEIDCEDCGGSGKHYPQDFIPFPGLQKNAGLNAFFLNKLSRLPEIYLDATPLAGSYRNTMIMFFFTEGRGFLSTLKKY